MVIAVAEFQLLVVLIDARADSSPAREIKCRSFDVAEFSSGNRTGVDGRKKIGRDGQSMIENVPVALARKIEIGMMRKIYDRVFVGRGKVVNFQFVRVRQRVDDLGR